MAPGVELTIIGSAPLYSMIAGEALSFSQSSQASPRVCT